MSKEYFNQNGGVKVCNSMSFLLCSAIRLGMQNSGGRLFPDQVAAARELATKDVQSHQKNTFLPGEDVEELNRKITRIEKSKDNNSL